MKRNLSDSITDVVGSWKFIIFQTMFLAAFTLISFSFKSSESDLLLILNLILSFQAAYTAPIILMSHSRMGQRDRRLLQQDVANTKQILLRISKLETNLIKEVDDLEKTIVNEVDEAVTEISDKLDDEPA